MFNITLYQCSAESNKLNKRRDLKYIKPFVGTLRENCSIITPAVLLDGYQFTELDYDNLFKFNYMYIQEFERYYFITDIILISNQLIEITGRVDVLDSFKNDIYNMIGILDRSSNNSYISVYASDNLLPTDGTIEMSYFEMPPLTTFDYIYTTDYVYATPVFVTVTNLNNFPISDTIALKQYAGNSNPLKSCERMPLLPNYAIGGFFPYGAERSVVYSAFSDCISEIANSNSLSSFLLHAYVLPFDVGDVSNVNLFYDTTTDDGHLVIPLGNDMKDMTGWDDDKVHYRVFTNRGFSDKPLYMFTFNCSSFFSSPYDVTPFSSYILRLPFYGEIDLDPNILIKYPKLIVMYFADFINNKFEIIIKACGLNDTIIEEVMSNNYSENFVIIDEITCQMGLELPFNSTSQEETTRTQTANILTILVSLLTAAVGFGSIGAGAGAAGALAGLGGISGATKALENSIKTLPYASSKNKNADGTFSSYNILRAPVIYKYKRNGVDGSDDMTGVNYFKNIFGMKSNVPAVVRNIKNNNFHKYLEIHVEGTTATDQEKEEIHNILTTGFIF